MAEARQGSRAGPQHRPRSARGSRAVTEDSRAVQVSVRRVLDSSINIAWNEIRHRARLVKDYGDTPMVEGNESRLGQVFLNLLLNAAHAIPEGETEPGNEIRVSTRTDGRGRAVVEVRDTGMGIPADIRDKIFDPFFTTKPASEGTGLGLWILRRDFDHARRPGAGRQRDRARQHVPGHAAGGGDGGLRRVHGGPHPGAQGPRRAPAGDRRRATMIAGRAPPLAQCRSTTTSPGRRRRPQGAGAAAGGRALRRHPLRPHDAGDDRHGPLHRKLEQLAPDQAARMPLFVSARVHAARAGSSWSGSRTPGSRSRSTCRTSGTCSATSGAKRALAGRAPHRRGWGAAGPLHAAGDRVAARGAHGRAHGDIAASGAVADELGEGHVVGAAGGVARGPRRVVLADATGVRSARCSSSWPLPGPCTFRSDRSCRRRPARSSRATRRCSSGISRRTVRTCSTRQIGAVASRALAVTAVKRM